MEVLPCAHRAGSWEPGCAASVATAAVAGRLARR